MNFSTILILWGLVILVVIMRPRIVKQYKKMQRQRELTRRIDSIETYTPKQAINAAEREINRVLLEDACPSKKHFKSSKKFEVFDYTDISNGQEGENQALSQKKYVLTRQIRNLQNVRIPKEITDLLPAKDSSMPPYLSDRYNKAKEYCTQLETLFLSKIQTEENKLANELQSIDADLKKRTTARNNPALTLSSIFPESFKPLIIPDLEGLDISISGIGKGIFKGKDINVMYDCVDIDTCSIEFDSMIWHFYQHELVIEEKNNIAILSYDDIKAKIWNVSTKSIVANSFDRHQITLEIQGETYDIQPIQNEIPFWISAIINYKQHRKPDFDVKDVAFLALQSNPEGTQIALKYLIKTLLLENMISVEGGEMEQGYKYRVEFFPYNDHRKKLFSSDQHGERIIRVNDFKMSRDLITERLWGVINGQSAGDKWEEPKTKITYENVQQFIAKINKITGLSFRLPTENEWEYAARGGKKSKGYLFAGSNDLNEARKSPNELGFLRMTGCVWQMCDGEYVEWSNGNFNEPDPSHARRVARGGSINSIEHACYTDGRKCEYIVYNKFTAEKSTAQYVPDRDLVCPPNRFIFGNRIIASNELGFRLVLQN